MKINSLYENYLRKNLMKPLKINLGDVIIMDNNTWHRASFIENRENLINSNFECKKILLNFEIINDEKIIRNTLNMLEIIMLKIKTENMWKQRKN